MARHIGRCVDCGMEMDPSIQSIWLYPGGTIRCDICHDIDQAIKKSEKALRAESRDEMRRAS